MDTTNKSTNISRPHLNRTEAFAIINRERQYQDATYNPNEVLPSGATRFQRDQEIGSHLVLLDSYIRKAKDEWTFTRQDNTSSRSSSFKSLRQVAKIAAIAVRALERMPEGIRLLEEGLRDEDPAPTVKNDATGTY